MEKIKMIPRTNAELEQNKEYQKFSYDHCFRSSHTPYNFYKRYPTQKKHPGFTFEGFKFHSKHNHWKTAKAEIKRLEGFGYKGVFYETSEAQRVMTRGPKDHKYTWYVYKIKNKR
jgi:hypothetical protein